MKRTAKKRLDTLLVEQGLASDLKEAQALVLSGQVRLLGQPTKPGMLIVDLSSVTISKGPRYVSRAGDKLESALEALAVSPAGHVCIDVGSSTGGFVDCLLQRGAASVWAVDVGTGLLDSRLRRDPRVRTLEGVNFRHLSLEQLSERPTFLTADVSFISLTKLFPKMHELLEPAATALVMVKPQFEGTPKEVPKGIVRDEETRQLILSRFKRSAELNSFVVLKTADSALAGRKGNIETFFLLGRAR